MNIVVLSGSPRKGANTDTMVEAFAETAREGGNTVEVVRVASKKIAGCLGCQYCFAHEGTCVQKDDMAAILDKMVQADVLVLATPVYFYSMDGQLKTLIDRTLPRYTEIRDKEVRLVSAEGEQLGIMSAREALEKAIEANKAGKPFLVEAPMENIVVPTPGCWNINDIYSPNELVKEGKLVKKENGQYVAPSHSKSHDA